MRQDFAMTTVDIAELEQVEGGHGTGGGTGIGTGPGTGPGTGGGGGGGGGGGRVIFKLL